MKTVNLLIILTLLFIISPPVYAAELVAWKNYLAIIMAIAAVGGYILSVRNEKAEGRAAKIILGGLYFWVITFAELIILATVYHFTQ